MITILLILIVLMLLLMSSKREGYPVKQIVIDDPSFDTTEYVESTDVRVDNDLVEKLVMATNRYLADKT